MRIELKQNNRPKKPGYYLCQRNKERRPEVAEVRQENYGLWMLHGIGGFPLKQCEKDALWSDEISFA
jgi:hypothetical protein